LILTEGRKLAEGTRSAYLRIVERLLLYKFADRPVVFCELQPDDVRRFIANQLESLDSISNATTIAATLRAYRQQLGRTTVLLFKPDRLIIGA
jgi:hypothetical protein